MANSYQTYQGLQELQHNCSALDNTNGSTVSILSGMWTHPSHGSTAIWDELQLQVLQQVVKGRADKKQRTH